MPRALVWSAEQDQHLVAVLDQPAGTLRKAAEHFGVSRSFLQRRAAVLIARSTRCACTLVREEAGSAPLPAHHPISWNAIALPLHA